MSRSEQIRDLLSRFPALKPKAIERLLAARGVEVDANLIGVARLRQRRQQEADRVINRLLGTLLMKHPTLFPIIQASVADVLSRLVAIATLHPGFANEQICDVLANEYVGRPVPETLVARFSRLYARVLEKYPQYERSMELVIGLRGTNRRFIAMPQGNGLEDQTDEQLEEGILAYLEENFPAGSTVEAIARAYYDTVDRRRKRADKERLEMAQAARDRAEKVLALVLEAIGSAAIDEGAALEVTQNFVAQHADWPDEDISKMLVASLELAAEQRDQPPQQLKETEALYVIKPRKKRPKRRNRKRHS